MVVSGPLVGQLSQHKQTRAVVGLNTAQFCKSFNYSTHLPNLGWIDEQETTVESHALIYYRISLSLITCVLYIARFEHGLLLTDVVQNTKPPSVWPHFHHVLVLEGSERLRQSLNTL